MRAYDKGRLESGTRDNRRRTYETEKAESEYWRGYIDAMREKLRPDEMLVRCDREGRIFVAHRGDEKIVCPTCGRWYLKQNGVYVSDRELIIL